MQNLGSGLVTLVVALLPMKGQLTLGGAMLAMTILVGLSLKMIKRHAISDETVPQG
nr:hypothetical protein [Dongshaea marina]